ncbi:MAG: hypothetical protein AAGD25_06525 [Cyanobacteria bacterium P01_F01_bin.150]
MDNWQRLTDNPPPKDEVFLAISRKFTYYEVGGNQRIQRHIGVARWDYLADAYTFEEDPYADFAGNTCLEVDLEYWAPITPYPQIDDDTFEWQHDYLK